MSEKRRIVGRTVGTPLSLDKIKEINLREFPDDELHRTVSEDEKAEWNKKVKSVNGKEANELGAVSLSATDVGAEQIGQTARVVGMHNANTSAHNDIRLLIAELGNRLNAVANSEDVNLDQLSEIVAYIKSNKSLIDTITTNKVNYSDIINNLTTNVSNKPLSAAQGVALKSLLDNLDALVGKFSGYGGATSIAEYIAVVKNDLDEYVNFFMEQVVELDNNKLNTTELPTAIEDALSTAKSSGEFDGKDGADGKDGTDGVGILGVTQIVSSNESNGTNVISMGLTDGTKYNFTVKNGKKGSDGKSAYQYAQDGGYTGTEEEFAAKMASENTGSGSVQSDWTQNDETAPDYVKGRTHWSEYKETVLIDNASISSDPEANPMYSFALVEGQEYKVTVGGVEYTETAVLENNGEMDIIYVGNGMLMGFADNGKNYVIAHLPMAGFTMPMAIEETTITLITQSEIVNQLPKKYVADLMPYFVTVIGNYTPETPENLKNIINSGRLAIAKTAIIDNGVETVSYSYFNVYIKSAEIGEFYAFTEAFTNKTIKLTVNADGGFDVEMS